MSNVSGNFVGLKDSEFIAVDPGGGRRRRREGVNERIGLSSSKYGNNISDYP